jgi:hypothetical protein
MMSYFQWRMSKGLADLSAALPTAMGLGTDSVGAPLGPAEPAKLRLPGGGQPAGKGLHELEQNLLAGSKPRQGTNVAIQHLLLPDPGALVRRRQMWALRTAVIVGLLCAAGLALLFYLVTYRKLGFGYLHGMFII